jgi:hypothetical protein
MAIPTVSASLDKATYTPGETMTLTVNYSDSDRQTLVVTVTVADSQGNTSAPASVNAVVDPLTVNVSSTPARSWTQVSNTGAVAVYTTTA